MTAQEAIKAIQIKEMQIECKATRMCEFCEGLVMAEEALEKQIPKKVIFEDDGESLLCPRCGFDLMGSITEPDHDPYYCFECGQALDWSKQNEQRN